MQRMRVQNPRPAAAGGPRWRPRSVVGAAGGRRRLGGGAARATGQQQDEAGPSSSSSSSSPGTAAPAAPAPAGPQPSLENPAETIVWGGRLPSRRRATVGGLTAAAIALGGNLGGITSWLFGLDGGELASRLRADVLVPVRGFKRCVDQGNGFEFVYPAAWLSDLTVAYRQAQRTEAARGLDPPAPRRPRRQVAEPTVAFGPPGSSGEENVSVIVAPIFAGFQLSSLGSPAGAAQNFLDTIVAPPGSDKTARLVAAEQRLDADGVLYYQMEFTVSRPVGGRREAATGPAPGAAPSSAAFDRHNVAVLASRNDLLYTLNCQCPAARWADDGGALLRTARSFRLLPSAAGRQFPGTLR